MWLSCDIHFTCLFRHVKLELELEVSRGPRGCSLGKRHLPSLSGSLFTHTNDLILVMRQLDSKNSFCQDRCSRRVWRFSEQIFLENMERTGRGGFNVGREKESWTGKILDGHQCGRGKLGEPQTPRPMAESHGWHWLGNSEVIQGERQTPKTIPSW